MAIEAYRNSGTILLHVHVHVHVNVHVHVHALHCVVHVIVAASDSYQYSSMYLAASCVILGRYFESAFHTTSTAWWMPGRKLFLVGFCPLIL